jgi:hypothetical protein
MAVVGQALGLDIDQMTQFGSRLSEQYSGETLYLIPLPTRF